LLRSVHLEPATVWAQQLRVQGVGRLDRFFEISARQSTIAAELRGGVVTFIAMAYIIVLNPIILSSGQDVDGTKLEFAQVSAMTSLAAGIMTVLFGVIARCRSRSPRASASTRSWPRPLWAPLPGPKRWAWLSSTDFSSCCSR
jgi:hypothetical protein